MASMDVLRFLEYYQQYPCLWDKALRDYKDRQKRDQAEEALMKLTKLNNIKLLRGKIRSIRGTFNNELRKVKLSKMPGSSGVYKPKLIWYDYAYSFLSKNIESERTSEINLILKHDENDDDMYVENGHEIYMENKHKIYVENEHGMCFENDNFQETPLTASCEMSSEKQTQVLSQSFPSAHTSHTKKNRNRLGTKKKCKEDYKLREALETLKEVCQSVRGNEFTLFGQQVGVQLNKLSLVKAIEVQNQIHNIIREARLSEICTNTNEYTTASATSCEPSSEDIDESEELESS